MNAVTNSETAGKHKQEDTSGAIALVNRYTNNFIWTEDINRNTLEFFDRFQVKPASDLSPGQSIEL